MRMKDQFSRTALLMGSDAVDRLGSCRAALFGVGGVGGFAAEAMVRAGLGGIDLFDDDVVCASNLNRQIVALHSTLGRPKVEVMRERLLDINPDVDAAARRMFYMPERAGEIEWERYDYIVDCIDTVTAKLDLIVQAARRGIPIISAMGAGNELDSTAFEVADISRTSVCPLARVMRQELRRTRRGASEGGLFPRTGARAAAGGERRSAPDGPALHARQRVLLSIGGGTDSRRRSGEGSLRRALSEVSS